LVKDDGARALPDNFVQPIIKTRAERYDACEVVRPDATTSSGATPKGELRAFRMAG
jgi:hypothetical protein